MGRKPRGAAASNDADKGVAEAAVPVRYPDHLMVFPPEHTEAMEAQWQDFYNLRERILLEYSPNTARAYYADLQDIFEWAVARGKDVLLLTGKDIRQYCALLRRRKYSENTIRRRMVAWRKLTTVLQFSQRRNVGKYDAHIARAKEALAKYEAEKAEAIINMADASPAVREFVIGNIQSRIDEQKWMIETFSSEND